MSLLHRRQADGPVVLRVLLAADPEEARCRVAGGACEHLVARRGRRLRGRARRCGARAAARPRSRASGRTSPGRGAPARQGGTGTASGRRRRPRSPGGGRAGRRTPRRPSRPAGRPARRLWPAWPRPRARPWRRGTRTRAPARGASGRVASGRCGEVAARRRQGSGGGFHAARSGKAPDRWRSESVTRFRARSSAPASSSSHARRAEEAGFDYALISDHFHPWIDRQGQSPFVWTVLGGIASETERMTIGTGVTCPILRMHPALVAQAAATAADMLPGRFFLGVGTGEHLNEHILAQRWPSASERLDMLEEAINAHPLALGRRIDHASRRPLRRRGRPHLHAPRRAAADRGRGRRAGRRGARRAGRRRPRIDECGRGARRRLRGGRRGRAPVRAGDRVLGGDRERRPQDRVRAVAERCARGAARPGAAAAARTSSRPRRW